MATKSKNWDKFVTFFLSTRLKVICFLLLCCTLIGCNIIWTDFASHKEYKDIYNSSFYNTEEYALSADPVCNSVALLTSWLNAGRQTTAYADEDILIRKELIDENDMIIYNPANFTYLIITSDGTVATNAEGVEDPYMYFEPRECDFFYSGLDSKAIDLYDLYNLEDAGNHYTNSGQITTFAPYKFNFSFSQVNFTYRTDLTFNICANDIEKCTIFIKADPEWIAAGTQHFEDIQALFKDKLMQTFGLLTAAGLLLLYLLLTAGKKEKGMPAQSRKFDRVFTELYLALGIAGAGLALYFISYIWDLLDSFSLVFFSALMGQIAVCGILFISELAVFAALFALCRKIRFRMFWRTTLLYWIFSRLYIQLNKVFLFLSRLLSGKSQYGVRRLCVYLLLRSVFFFLLMMGVILSFMYIDPGFLVLFSILGFIGWGWYSARLWNTLRELLKTEQYISALGNGQYDADSHIEPDSPFAQTAYVLEHIGSGFSDSLNRQIKSERMKVDLITNVSHDLKTPLTSIIGYLDLLEKEELPPVAEDYVHVLRRKSDRLSDMVQDLFTLAKSTSGTDESTREHLDLQVLIKQVLADLEDRIAQSNLSLRTNLPEEPLPMYADGNKLYRIFQNLLDNAIKYALPGTRIYLNASASQQRVSICLQNVSAYEMTFSPDEISERFVRGDPARSSEGNGLGLAIAKSFAQSQGGILSVHVDGDVFKVIVTFPLNP